jgi:hypothetical protein
MSNTCQAFLTASRAVAKKRNGWTDRACAVFEHGGDWYEVRDYEDNVVWHGQAHCRYCARAEAIATKAGAEIDAQTDFYINTDSTRWLRLMRELESEGSIPARTVAV